MVEFIPLVVNSIQLAIGVYQLGAAIIESIRKRFSRRYLDIPHYPSTNKAMVEPFPTYLFYNFPVTHTQILYPIMNLGYYR